MKILLILGFAGASLLAGAQTNALIPKMSLAQIVIKSHQAYYDGNAHQIIYYDDVLATNASLRMTCAWLAIDMPSTGNPTNIVAETNVVMNFTDQKGQTNLLVADKAVYSYSLANSVTNETITFTGHTRYENANIIETGDPIIWTNVDNNLYVSNPVTMFRKTPNYGNGTNGSPLNIFK